MAAKKLDPRDIPRMLDDLNNYHESNVAGVRMRVTMDPSRDKYKQFHLFVNGKKVSSKRFAPSADSQKTHPFGGAGGIAEAVFSQAVQSR